MRCLTVSVALVVVFAGVANAEDAAELRSELIFPLHAQHNHAPGDCGMPERGLVRVLVSRLRGAQRRRCGRVRRTATQRRDAMERTVRDRGHTRLSRLQHVL